MARHSRQPGAGTVHATVKKMSAFIVSWFNDVMVRTFRKRRQQYQSEVIDSSRGTTLLGQASRRLRPHDWRRDDHGQKNG